MRQPWADRSILNLVSHATVESLSPQAELAQPQQKACGYIRLEQKRRLWLPTWIAVIQLVKKYLIWVEEGCHFYHEQYCLITKVT